MWLLGALEDTRVVIHRPASDRIETYDVLKRNGIGLNIRRLLYLYGVSHMRAVGVRIDGRRARPARRVRHAETEVISGTLQVGPVVKEDKEGVRVELRECECRGGVERVIWELQEKNDVDGRGRCWYVRRRQE